MENKDREYMRFIAACFVMVGGASAKMAVQQADQLLDELEGEKETTGGIVDIVPKRKRTRAN
jgi:hypothetical protein